MTAAESMEGLSIVVGRRNRLSAEIERQAIKCLALLMTERGWDSITVDAGRRTLIGELDFGNGDFNDDPDEMAKLSDELADVLGNLGTSFLRYEYLRGEYRIYRDVVQAAAVTHGVIMNLCAEENVYREAMSAVGKYDDRDAQAHALRAFVQLLRCTGVVQTYSLTELRDADLDKVDWLAVAEGVGE